EDVEFRIVVDICNHCPVRIVTNCKHFLWLKRDCLCRKKRAAKKKKQKERAKRSWCEKTNERHVNGYDFERYEERKRESAKRAWFLKEPPFSLARSRLKIRHVYE